jgi:hypothetical protein
MRPSLRATNNPACPITKGGKVTSLGPPSVDIVSSGGAALEIRWPTNAFGYSLEAATNLPGIWTSVTNAIVISGDQFTVQVPTDAPGRFYRLRK